MSGWEFTDEPRRPDIGSGLVSELLKPLADADLVEYCRSWVWDRYRYEATGNGFSAWNCGKGLSTDARVRFLSHGLQARYSDNILGRIFRGSGELIDGGPDLSTEPTIDVAGPTVNRPLSL